VQRVTETGNGKSFWECSATWRIRLNNQTTFGPKYDIHMKLYGDLTCRFVDMVSALLQDYGTEK